MRAISVIPRLVVWTFLSVMLAFGAKAEEFQVTSATTLICGTSDEVKQLLSDNQNLQQVFAAVNEGSSRSKSCLIAPIAYVTGKGIDRVERTDGTFIVTEILIVGVGTPYGMLAIKPSVVYTVQQAHEEAA